MFPSIDDDTIEVSIVPMRLRLYRNKEITNSESNKLRHPPKAVW